MITSEEIKRRLWEGANDLRGSMDASKYKDYMLGLMFYKFLSDKTLEAFKTLSVADEDVDLLEAYTKARINYGDKLDEQIQTILGYYVLPEHLYQTWLKDIRVGDFELQKVMESLNNFERTIAVTNDQDDFKGLFSSSIIDLTNSALGSDLNKRSKNIKDLILLFSDLNMVDLQDGDILGDAYEYLIGQFASNAGKKAGEFYTPHQVSEVMAQIVAKTTDISSIYDPTVGSGSLLLTVKKHLSEDVQSHLHYYGQEYITETYNLTRMNLLLHGIRPTKMNIKNGNTLAQDWPEDPSRPNDGIQFDAVVMNPPYSDKKWNRREDKPLKVSDPRFADFGILPPDGKGDFAYLMHGLYHLGMHGTMAIVLPHGVLFRGAAEGEIRKRLLKKNYIDAIIGLPSNLFTNTGIPVCVLILKKNRELSAPVLIIDASRHFTKVGKQNVLQERDIAKIVDTYVEKVAIEGYSYLATQEDIIENEYNMNIPRYVTATDEEIPHDVDAHLYGGIPQTNINDLKIIQSITGDILNQAFTKVREGYVELNMSLPDLTNKILADSRIQAISETLKEKTINYIDTYWNLLRQIDTHTHLIDIKEKMLVDMKQLLSEFQYIDIYAGYQIIAEIWKNTLTHDAELIKGVGFYNAGRDYEPHMVVKGTGDKKREEQDGWIGALVPNELIAKNLYSEEREAIEYKKTRIIDIDNELSELVEAAKVEDSVEFNALYESLKKNEDDEPQDSFETKTIKSELKKVNKDTQEYKLLRQVEDLIQEKTDHNKAIIKEEKDLKEAVYKRIPELTDKEIDDLVYEKWFGTVIHSVTNLIEVPLKEELATLDMLQERYASTLIELDKEISDLESAFEMLTKELVVM